MVDLAGTSIAAGPPHLTMTRVGEPDLLAGGPGNDVLMVSGPNQAAVDRGVWQAGDADGGTDRVTGLDNDASDQGLFDLSAVLTGLGNGTLANLRDNIVARARRPPPGAAGGQGAPAQFSPGGPPGVGEWI